MKRLLLAAIGVTGLLASCGPGGSVDNTVPTMTQASGLYTSHQLSVNVTDVNTGTVYPAGTYVICDNKNTTIELGVAWTGALYNLDVYATGGYYGDTHLLGTYTANGAYNSSGTISYTFGAGAAPLSLPGTLKAQGITVTPVTNVNIKGQTSIIVQGNNYYDTPGNYITATTLNTVPNNYQLPVVDCL